MKLNLIDVLIYLLLFIFVVCLPIDLLKTGIVVELIIKISVRLILLLFYFYIIHKREGNIFYRLTFKEFILFLPFFIICFSNIFASLIDGGFNYVKTDGVVLFLGIVLCLFTALLEEIVFRFFIHSSLVEHKPIPRILLSALIFGLCHLVNLANVRSVDALLNVLLQMVYTFGLGLVLGFVFEFSHSLILVTILHFCFNLFNDVLYSFFGGYTSDIAFILTAVVISLLVVLYTLFLYFKKFKKGQQETLS